jgi:hypothetical protein
MEKTIRKPVFAGKFYPGSAHELSVMIDNMNVNRHKLHEAEELIGGIVPHAGYVYSGHHAVPVYNAIKNYHKAIDTFVIINPNHTGIGNGNFNVSGVDEWETPLGSVETDKEFISALNVEINELAHQSEHSGEVQLPFLQHFLPYNFKVVMITLNRQTPSNAVALAKLIAEAREKTQRKIFILASSDFSHYENPLTGFEKDQYVVNEILKLNTDEIFQQVRKNDVTACGFGCIMTLTAYANENYENPEMQVLSRGNSGEVISSSQVVDYISILCYQSSLVR